MSKLDEKKRQKRESLLDSAFTLFISKGINDTSISDIVKNANMAKGTFYLYFKDKFDLRDKLITSKAMLLFRNATENLAKKNFNTLEENVIYIVDSVIDQLNEDKQLLKFISKKLGWGIFQNVLTTEDEQNGGYSFNDIYYSLLEKSGRKFKNPDLMLYMIVELINSSCYNVILEQQPVTLNVLKPELYATVEDIIHRHEIK